MAKKIEKLEVIRRKDVLRDPIQIYNILKKVNELVDAVNGYNPKSETGRSLEAAPKS